ncbi:hypothetical protein ANO11243_083680 [Dothideomycetidae sp. 11243]|nr:hypothetical protein ANO11243_083680 [fungal sp. No.11243]
MSSGPQTNPSLSRMRAAAGQSVRNPRLTELKTSPRKGRMHQWLQIDCSTNGGRDGKIWWQKGTSMGEAQTFDLYRWRWGVQRYGGRATDRPVASIASHSEHL